MIKAIALTNGGHAIVDANRFEELNRFKWRMNADGYASRYVSENATTILMHRVVNGTPDGFETDHKNGIRHFNWARNLRTATSSQNKMNVRKRRTPTSSRFKGVYCVVRENRWRAQAGHKFLGFFHDEIQAAIAYNRAARELFGEFALLNDVDESLYDPKACLSNSDAKPSSERIGGWRYCLEHGFYMPWPASCVVPRHND